MNDLDKIIMSAIETRDGRDSLVKIFLGTYLSDGEFYVMPGDEYPSYTGANNAFKNALRDKEIPEELIYDLPEFEYKLALYKQRVKKESE